MLCEKCQKNQATIHIVKVINGEKHEINICQSCAKEGEELNIPGEFISPFSFQNILSGFVDYMNKSSQSAPVEVRCPKCGISDKDFKTTGLVGCEQCYTTFNSLINPIVRRVQGRVEHRGKVPAKACKDILERNKLSKLKEELQNAVQAEEYERAAAIRDEIKALQGNINKE